MKLRLRRKFLWHLILLGFVLVVFAAAGLGYMLTQPLAHDDPVRINVPEGSSFSSVLYRLEGQDLLGEGLAADSRMVAARVYALIGSVAERMHVGEYEIDPGTTLRQFFAQLEEGDVLMRQVTLVEGWNIRQVRKALNDAEGLSHATADLDNAALMQELGKPDRHPEGWFAPDTYAYTRGDTDLEVLARALDHQERILEQAWAERAEDLPLDSPYEVLILASIVEKETAVPDERETVAAVFENRLEKGMRMQTDPTVIYGLGEAYDGNLQRRHLEDADNPYNTYRHAGLPPTPIAMPGAASIRAAVQPAETEVLYFVARGDGTHKFSRTFEEHQQAVREYQLRRRKDYRSTPEPEPEPEPEAREATDEGA